MNGNSGRELSNLTMADVAKHSTADDCWIAINGNVYDLSSFNSHPGGDAFVQYCGAEATQAFDTKGGQGGSHSDRAMQMLPRFLVGKLVA